MAIFDILKCFKKKSGVSVADYSDWFEQTNGIPIVASQKNSETELFNRVYAVFKFLEDIQARDLNGDLIVDKARKDYMSNVKSRALRFYGQTTSLKTKIDADALLIPIPDHFKEDLRDFYHSSYYCLYFCARYYLLDFKMLDTNIHDKIPLYLEKLATKDQSQQPLVDRLDAAYSTLQRYRNRADYNMAAKTITELSDPKALSDAVNMISQLSKDCGVR
jgi:hypothetical protein